MMRKKWSWIVWVLVVLCVPWVQGTETVEAKEWTIPLAGNAYRTAPEPGRLGPRRAEGIVIDETVERFSVFFRVDRPAALKLTLVARATEGSSSLKARVAETEFRCQIDSGEWATVSVGSLEVEQAGYVRLDLQANELNGDATVSLRELIVTSETADLQLDFVRSNDGNMFYWGRRGPSVHLSYATPPDRNLQWAYSEITVPEGQDPIGSYYMANGFGEGYFGIQVNSEQERRVLFSVWSPFSTDDPQQIPEDQRIAMLARGPDVHTGEFGNEGSGGQSYLIYPWKAGRTYRFLTEVKPDGQGSTTYTSWFGDRDRNEWRLIASFRRPKTDTHLRGFHSFLESFSPEHGFVGRRANYGNVWVRSVDGMWHECVTAKFSVDATGDGRHRLDFAGGSEGMQFYLKNCGFFGEPGVPGTSFTRQASPGMPPQIDWDSLPRQ